MDESNHLLLSTKADCDAEELAQPRDRRGGWQRKRVAIGAILMLVLFAIIGHRRQTVYKADASTSEAEKKVRVEFFVMSRCPDAVKMEQAFSQVVDSVHSIMDVQLSFIAKPDANATLGAVCKHGEYECRGNIDELCGLQHKLDLPS
ncbi:hypothetical protein GGI22_002573, partial [Coemansia erecta]